MDALLVRLKMTLHSEYIIAVITVEQAEFSVVLLHAVHPVVVKQHKTEATAAPAIQLVKNNEKHIRDDGRLKFLCFFFGKSQNGR